MNVAGIGPAIPVVAGPSPERVDSILAGRVVAKINEEKEQWNGIFRSIITICKKILACIAAFFRWLGTLLRLLSRDPAKEAEEAFFARLVEDSRELVEAVPNCRNTQAQHRRQVLLVETLLALPVEQRRSEEMDRAIKGFVDTGWYDQNYIEGLGIPEELRKLPQEQRAQALLTCYRMLTPTGYAIKAYLLCPEMQFYPFKELMGETRNKEIFRLIERVPKSERKRFLEACRPLLGRAPYLKEYTMKALSSLPTAQWNRDSVRRLASLFALNTFDQKRLILRKIQGVPEETRTSFITHLTSTLSGLSSERKDKVLKAVDLIPPEDLQREGLFDAILAAFEADDDFPHSPRVFLLIERTPANSRAQFLLDLHENLRRIPRTENHTPFMEVLSKSDTGQPALVHFLATLFARCNEREAEAVRSLVHDIGREDRNVARIGREARNVARRARKKFLSDWCGLARGGLDGVWHKAAFALLSVPQSPAIAGVFSALLAGDGSLLTACRILKILAKRPPGSRKTVLLRWGKIVSRLPEQIVREHVEDISRLGFYRDPPELVGDCLAHLLGDVNREARGRILASILQEPEPTRFVRSCSEAVRDISESAVRADAVEVLSRCPEGNQPFSAVTSLFTGLDETVSRALMEKFRELYSRSLSQLLMNCESIIQETDSSLEKYCIVRSLYCVPPPQRSQRGLREAIISLFAGVDLHNADLILELITRKQGNLRVKFILTCHEMVGDVEDPQTRIQTIRFLANTPEEHQREEGLKEALAALVERTSPDIVSQAASWVGSQPKSSSVQFIRDLTDAYEATESVGDSRLRGDLVHALTYLSPEERREGDVKESLLTFLDARGREETMQIVQKPSKPDRAQIIKLSALLAMGDPTRELLTQFLDFCLLTAPEDREGILQLFAKGREIRSLRRVFQQDPQILTRARAYLFRSLENLEAREELRRIARRVEKHRRDLGLQENDPLFQRMVEVIAFTDPVLADRPFHPYVVYAKLHRGRALNIHPARELVAGRTLAHWNVEGMRERARGVHYRREDLAEGVCWEVADGGKTTIFHEVVARLQNRRERSCAQEFLNNTGVRALLYPEGENVSVYSYQLFQIGKALAEASQEEQEAMLLAIAESIRFCAGGVREGVALYFNSLPEQYRRDQRAAAVEEKVQNFLETELHQHMTNAFADDVWLEKTFNQRTQGSHATLFLKNLLHQLVGYKGHTLQYDYHTGVLSDQLIACLDNERVLTQACLVYFHRLCLSEFLSKIQRKIDAFLDPKTERPRFSAGGLIHFLSQGRESSTQPLFEKGILEDPSGDYTGPFTITKKGVLALLVRAGLVSCEDREVQQMLCI